MVGRGKRALIQRVIRDHPTGIWCVPCAGPFAYRCPLCRCPIWSSGTVLVPFITLYFKHLARHPESDLKAYAIERILAGE